MVRRPPFGVLSDVTEACEDHGASVQSVTTTMGDADVTVQLVVDHRMDATLGTVTPEAATVTADGRIRVEGRPPSLAAVAPTEVPITDERLLEVTVADAGTLRCTHEFTLSEGDEGDEENEENEENEALVGGDRDDPDGPPSEERPAGPITDGGAVDGTAPPGLASARDPSLPAYEDVDYLRTLYEACETFEEMSRHIEMDVVAETVRRYMIDAGIHTPDSYDTVGDEDAGSAPVDAPVMADGLGLPADVGVDDLIDAIVGAATVYEVDRELGLGRERTRSLLTNLGLLDRVMHRVATEHQTVSREEVVRQLRDYGAG